MALSMLAPAPAAVRVILVACMAPDVSLAETVNACEVPTLNMLVNESAPVCAVPAALATLRPEAAALTARFPVEVQLETPNPEFTSLVPLCTMLSAKPSAALAVPVPRICTDPRTPAEEEVICRYVFPLSDSVVTEAPVSWPLM